MKKLIQKINKFQDKFADTKILNIIAIPFFVAYIILIAFILNHENAPKKTDDADVIKTMEAIKKVESEEPSRISENSTEEEIYNNDYIKNIRTGLNGYLNGSNTGVEEYAIEKSDLVNDKVCGLKSFDKSYFKSKFIVIGASDNDYGGVQADIFFIDKPDTLFWVWVYRLGGDGEYVLRAFCESSLFTDQEDPAFSEFFKNMMKESKYSL